MVSSKRCKNYGQNVAVGKSPQEARILHMPGRTIPERVALTLESIKLFIEVAFNRLLGNHHVERGMVVKGNNLRFVCQLDGIVLLVLSKAGENILLGLVFGRCSRRRAVVNRGQVETVDGCERVGAGNRADLVLGIWRRGIEGGVVGQSRVLDDTSEVLVGEELSEQGALILGEVEISTLQVVQGRGCGPDELLGVDESIFAILIDLDLDTIATVTFDGCYLGVDHEKRGELFVNDIVQLASVVASRRQEPGSKVRDQRQAKVLDHVD